MEKEYFFVKKPQEYIETLKSLLEHETLKEFFYLDGADVYCEKEIIGRGGITQRLDRLIIKEKEAVVVDYKSSQEAKEDSIKQVQEYMKSISEIYPNKKVSGFLIYMDNILVEEVM